MKYIYFVYTNVKEILNIFMAMYIPSIAVLSQPAQLWSRPSVVTLVENISTRTVVCKSNESEFRQEISLRRPRKFVESNEI